MLDSDSKYIDEYKRVDKICSDILGDPCGITAYIELMKKAVISGEDLPGSWSTAIKTLVHLRHIRNSIAHDTSPVSCTKNDLNSLKAFGRALSEGRDPISCLNSYKKQTQRRRSSSSGQDKSGGNSKNEPEAYENRRTAGRTVSLIFAAIILIIMVAAVFILKVFPQ